MSVPPIAQPIDSSENPPVRLRRQLHGAFFRLNVPTGASIWPTGRRLLDAPLTDPAVQFSRNGLFITTRSRNTRLLFGWLGLFIQFFRSESSDAFALRFEGLSPSE